jgi:hypothetical protein
MRKGKHAAFLLIGLIAGLFVHAATTPVELPGTYQLGFGKIVTTNQNVASAPVMLDTRNGTLFYFQGVQAGNGIRGQWIIVEPVGELKKNDRGIRYTPAPNG